MTERRPRGLGKLMPPGRIDQRTYRIDDPDEGETTIKAIDAYNAADVYFQHQWNGDAFDRGTVRVTDVETGEVWTVSCTITMQPNFDLSLVKDSP